VETASNPLSVVVVGGMGVGLSFAVDAAPEAGDTVLATAVTTVNGGKASNQAIGVAALGARCALVSAAGPDAFGSVARDVLARHGVATDAIVDLAGASTMVGCLLIEPSGENRIVVAPGALAQLTREHVAAAEDLIRTATVCVVSLEIPVEAAHEALLIARRHGVMTVLNPAPAPPVEEAKTLLALADVVTPNRSEAEHIAGAGADATEAARRLRALGAGCVVVTLGADGALVVDEDGEHRVAAPPVTAVDTSGAGDAFTAALCVGVGSGLPMREAAAFACRAASLIVQGTGFVEALDRWDGVRLPAAAA
jgi:ribokinase